MSQPSLYPLALPPSLLLSLHGWRKRSLSPSGALAASAVGYASLANPHPLFGTLLIVFYLGGSRATKVKADVKAKWEEHGDNEGEGEGMGEGEEGKKVQKEGGGAGGGRTATQVLCNSLTAVLCAVSYRFLLTTTSSHPHVVGGKAGWLTPQTLLLGALGHYSACLGDTLASELGILSTSPPRLVIDPRRTVPRGTNGGVSAWGLGVSALGGAVIGVSAVVVASLRGGREDVGGMLIGKVVALGTAAGFGGSMIDSLLGATLQRTLFSRKRGRVLIGSSPPPPRPRRRSRRNPSTTTNLATTDVDAASVEHNVEEEEWETITGRDVLSNNSVNALSSLVTAFMTAVVGRAVLPPSFLF